LGHVARICRLWRVTAVNLARRWMVGGVGRGVGAVCLRWVGSGVRAFCKQRACFAGGVLMNPQMKVDDLLRCVWLCSGRGVAAGLVAGVMPGGMLRW
jgi:hypothetical protein